jgi:hypothetical protein
MKIALLVLRFRRSGTNNTKLISLIFRADI